MRASDGSGLSQGASPGETSGAMAPAEMGKQEALKRFTVDLTETKFAVGRDRLVQICDLETGQRLSQFISPAPISSLALAPGEHEILMNRGIALEMLGRTDEARAAYRSFLAEGKIQHGYSPERVKDLRTNDAEALSLMRQGV